MCLACGVAVRGGVTIGYCGNDIFCSGETSSGTRREGCAQAWDSLPRICHGVSEEDGRNLWNYYRKNTDLVNQFIYSNPYKQIQPVSRNI